MARRAFYATLTHIDHQIRLVMGYLREAGLLDSTYIVFTADHGHMVGEHNMWCMTPFYEASAKIPLLIVPAAGDRRLGVGVEDDRLAEFGDIMPTALELAGLPIPEQVDQLSLIGTEKRDYIHGEHGEGVTAQRMIRRGNTKLIYYPVGNRAHLFDLEADPRETKDLATDPAHAEELASLVDLLLENLHGSDFEWVQDGKLTGLPDRDVGPISCKPLTGQRGLRFP